MKQTIKIDVDEYHEMKKGHDFLLFLQQCVMKDLEYASGSDNWKGYFRALSQYEWLTKMGEDDEKV